MSPSPSLDSIVGVRSVTEEPMAGAPPALTHPEWSRRWPGIVQGITVPGEERAWDFRLFGGAGTGVAARWERLGALMGCPAAAHARQPHGAAIRVHDALPAGLLLAPPVDAHATRARRILLAITVADCVPAWVVAPQRGAVAVVHAGWRGAAAGILETAVATLGDRFGAPPGELAVHLGPSICGDCYEVGPEVHEALGEAVPPRPLPVDLRANLARRAVAMGVPAEAVSRSTLCTRCGSVDLFSHRGGDAGRQVAFVALR
jgi:YfiH family protein